MHPAILNTLNKPPIIPPNLRANVLAWWDARERGQVWYGLSNIIMGGNFPNTVGWADTGCVLSVSGNVGSITGNGISANPRTTKATTIPCVTGKIIAVTLMGRVTNLNCTQMQIFVQGTMGGSTTVKAINNPVQNQWYPLLTTWATTAGTTGNYQFTIGHSYVDAATANGKVMEVKTVMAFDLSSPMGAGNEPTAAEMDAILTADGNQYWEGTRQVLCNPDFKYYWRDYSGNGRHMKLNNFAYSGASGWQSPYGLLEDGVDDWTGRIESGIIPANTSFSVVSILKPTSTKTVRGLYGFNASFTSNPVWLLYGTSTGFAFSIWDGVEVVASYSITTQIKPYMLVGVYDASDKKGRLYLDGNLVATSAAVSGTLVVNYFRTARNAGGDVYTPQHEYVDGMFNKALSFAEVKQLYSNNKRRFGI